jgi:hypothetical protein
MRMLIGLMLVFFLMIVTAPLSSAQVLGPYSGTVVDGQTGKPIEGASVLMHWTKKISQFMHADSDLIEVKLTYTDEAGKYRMPRLLANTGLAGKLESTHIIVYEPGYQTYIKSIGHDNPYYKPDPSFVDQGNKVKLTRIPPQFDHKKHYDEIEHALWGIRDYPYVYPQREDQMTWQRLLDMNLKTIPEKEEFLRRVEWEGSMMEGQK